MSTKKKISKGSKTLSKKIREKKQESSGSHIKKSNVSNNLKGLKKNILKEKKIVKEMYGLLNSLDKEKSEGDKRIIFSQIISLKKSLKEINKDLLKNMEKISVLKPLPTDQREDASKDSKSELLTKRKGPLTKTYSLKAFPTLKHLEFIELERETLKRLKKKIKEPKKVKVKKPSKYVNISNRIFSEFSISLIEQGMFKTLKRDLVKANLQFLTKSYVSVMFFTAFLSLILAFFIFLFFLFFNLSPELPIIIGVDEGLGSRFLKVIWIIFVIPIATFLAMYVYPSLERKSIETKINQELPFATIHMSAISGSLVEPSKIFHIIVETKEYPTLEKELIKLINEINVFGHDLVTGLRNVGSNSPSKKLAELFNGLATTITSGGDLTEYFDKRAQSLLFEYRLEREKNTKSAETFMDIYISVVIAAPMVIMLLLLVMKISGLGIGVSTGMITLIMILGVSMINIIFLTFLHLKQPPG